jgi:hypothetical protein
VRFLGLLLTLWLTAGCSSTAEGSPEAPAPDGGGPPDAPAFDVHCSSARPSYAADVAPIFQRNCSGGENCHSPPTRDNLIDASLEGALDCDGGEIDVSPGDLEKSYLMHKLTGAGLCGPYDDTMPPGSMLPRADIQTIADWICEGAPAN